jgi:regulator of RNase E activity RraA
VGAARGDINGSVKIAGITVSPGDLIIGDDDGLVALSELDLEAWLEAADARMKTERMWAARLANGETVKEVFGLS